MKLRFNHYIFIILLSWSPYTFLKGQEEYRVHAHNDYYHDLPFWYSYSSGANSIEVDLVLRNDTLYVAHEEEEINHHNTFQHLYLKHITTLINDGRLRPIQLLLDLKTDGYETLDHVVSLLSEYEMLTESELIKIVISGDRPDPEDYVKYPDYIFFDHQSFDDLDRVDLAKVAMISLDFKSYSVWNGYGRLTFDDLERVTKLLEAAEEVGLPFRFWGTPDTKTAWAFFADMGIGFINTDRPAEARIFLNQLGDKYFRTDSVIDTYVPTYGYDNTIAPSNIILMIGDGNGLGQISAAVIANAGNLSLINIKDIGLMKTSSADDLVTDSAGSGSAMATGSKTNNRAIGVDTSGESLPTLIEVLSNRGYTTGLITSDAIYGATPSAFYAHTPERDSTGKIIEDLINSQVDFFIAGGLDKAEKIAARFESRSLDQFEDTDSPKAIYYGDDKMPSIRNGRGNFMSQALQKSLAIMDKEDKPFFLMIEGAQIDSGGHANDIDMIIRETLDFDQVVKEALKFVDQDKETLLIITADHETGGLGIASGNTQHTLRADFLSVDHTATLVPVFAYGPQADVFTGVYENKEIFHKILSVLLETR